MTNILNQIYILIRFLTTILLRKFAQINRLMRVGVYFHE